MKKRLPRSILYHINRFTVPHYSLDKVLLESEIAKVKIFEGRKTEFFIKLPRMVILDLNLGAHFEK